MRTAMRLAVGRGCTASFSPARLPPYTYALFGTRPLRQNAIVQRTPPLGIVTLDKVTRATGTRGPVGAPAAAFYLRELHTWRQQAARDGAVAGRRAQGRVSQRPCQGQSSASRRPPPPPPLGSRQPLPPPPPPPPLRRHRRRRPARGPQSATCRWGNAAGACCPCRRWTGTRSR
jgi:hypothetical protein